MANQVPTAQFRRKTPIRGTTTKHPPMPEIATLKEDSRFQTLRNISAKRRNVGFSLTDRSKFRADGKLIVTLQV